MLPAVSKSLEPSKAWCMFRVNEIMFDARVPVTITKLQRPDLPTDKIYSIHQLAHVTKLLGDAASIVHWYKEDERPTIRTAVLVTSFTPAMQEAFRSALTIAASPRPDLPVQTCTVVMLGIVILYWQFVAHIPYHMISISAYEYQQLLVSSLSPYQQHMISYQYTHISSIAQVCTVCQSVLTYTSIVPKYCRKWNASSQLGLERS